MNTDKTVELIETTIDDPRVVAFHEAKDAELDPKYDAYAKEHGIRLGYESALDPTTIHVTYLALVDGEPAGTAALRQNDEKLEFKRLMVDPNFRGYGIAKRLMNRLEQDVLARGETRAWLHTGILQPEAIGLYESNGWERLPEVFPPYEEDGLSVCYTKQLDPAKVEAEAKKFA